MDDAVVLEREARLDRDRLVANIDLAIGRDRDDRRQNRRARFRVREHARSLAIHDGDETVGGAEVYSVNCENAPSLNRRYAARKVSNPRSISRSRVRKYAILERILFSSATRAWCVIGAIAVSRRIPARKVASELGEQVIHRRGKLAAAFLDFAAQFDRCIAAGIAQIGQAAPEPRKRSRPARVGRSCYSRPTSRR